MDHANQEYMLIKSTLSGKLRWDHFTKHIPGIEIAQVGWSQKPGWLLHVFGFHDNDITVFWRAVLFM